LLSIKWNNEVNLFPFPFNFECLKAKAGGDILERHPFVADESDIHSQGVLTSTRNFFLRHIERKQGAGSKGNSISGSGSNLIGEPKGGVQGKVQINHNSRPFSKDSSQSAIQFDPFPVAISLSGGVDSMVIAKILVTLRNSNQIPISEIIAIHIDYANREESSEEADFVENWCKELGITFHKRTINEVTRGITNRDEYEKVTREIRYSFYKSVLEEYNCEAVIFGHHLGDVQENVISNVMRGSNPLQLSGMTEIGVTNGVSVWRPLLSHPKDDIYEFSHKYGVPYFKDTTPSWSTRGKLRNKLIPLLLDMYGEGCLRNLTSLANESDSFRELVDQSIFLPFTQSIRRTKCGIIVNIVAYKNQPLCFWKEALMEIMHSMSMSMVREKSVGVFMERIQRKSTDMAGWLELRKGFHTYLYENGDFCVIADGILGDIAKTGRILNPNRGSNSLKGAVDENASSSSCAAVVEDKSAMNCWSGLSDNEWNWKTGLTVDLSGIRSEALSMKIGIWAVSISWVSDSSPSSPNPLNSLFKRHLEAETTPAALKESLALSSIRDVFSGSFEYLSAVPSHVNTLAIWSDFIVKANSTFPEISKFSPVPVHALSKSDPRIRLGIPFLVPITPDAKALSAEQIKNMSYSYTLIKVTYRLDKK
jgi:tRNA(Ile)-lysidine synthetase-like protein